MENVEKESFNSRERPGQKVEKRKGMRVSELKMGENEKD